jgi:hypothetical protein
MRPPRIKAPMKGLAVADGARHLQEVIRKNLQAALCTWRSPSVPANGLTYDRFHPHCKLIRARASASLRPGGTAPFLVENSALRRSLGPPMPTNSTVEAGINVSALTVNMKWCERRDRPCPKLSGTLSGELRPVR